MFRYLPEQASEIAPAVDWIHNLITDISVLFTVLVVGAMLYFAIRYRKRDGVDHETPRIEGSTFLEIIWTVVPTLISIYIAYYGIIIFFDMHKDADKAMIINATAKQWLWQFEYENGKKTIDEFVVPVGKTVKVVLTSEDVLHSFFVPAMRVKKDAVPGMYSAVVFKPVKTGTYNTFCTEYCGTQHSQMLAKLKVVPEAEYDRWFNDRSADLAKLTMTPAKLGATIYQEKACVTCHSLNGKAGVGPSFLKLYGKERKLTDGSVVKADEEYIRESILYSSKKVVEGYGAGIMPVFEGQLSSGQVKALIAFIRAQDGTQPIVEEEEEEVDLTSMSPEEKGEYIYKNNACIGCHSLDGSKLVGPTFKGAYGRQGKLSGGEEYQVTDEYIKNSILNPGSQIVGGYEGAVMPSYKGQLSDEDIAGVIAYLKTLQ